MNLRRPCAFEAWTKSLERTSRARASYYKGMRRQRPYDYHGDGQYQMCQDTGERGINGIRSGRWQYPEVDGEHKDKDKAQPEERNRIEKEKAGLQNFVYNLALSECHEGSQEDSKDPRNRLGDSEQEESPHDSA